jgi:hypothetical protein
MNAGLITTESILTIRPIDDRHVDAETRPSFSASSIHDVFIGKPN